MALRKRSREPDDVEGDVELEVEVESASSQLRMGNRIQKRTKIALAQAQGGAVASDDDEDDPDHAFHADEFLDDDMGSTNVNNDSTMLDPHDGVLRGSSDSEAEEEDDEIDEIQATQFVQKQMGQMKENVASDMGVIKEVYCRNFMCHSKLRIPLGPLINFIVGHNGSGKSAVLTALQICLGNKASGTNRAKTLKAMIKTGNDSGMVGVKIKNEGENSYKPELYGDTIVVERHFTKAGGSQYKLKSAEERLITNRKSDLDDILDYFALQMDNPINVLTQDLSRQFLSNSSPQDKYKFFLRGTRLETLDSDYKLIEENLDKGTAKMSSYEEDVTEHKRRFVMAEAKKKQADQNGLIHHRINETQRQHAWSQVELVEQHLEEMRKDVQTAQEKVIAAEQTKEEVDVLYEAQATAKAAADSALEQHKGSLTPLQDTHNAAQDAFKSNTKKLTEKNAEERTIRDNLKKAKRDIKRLEEEIAAETARLSGEHGDAHARRQEQLRDLGQKVQEAKEALDDHSARQPEVEQNLTYAAELLDHAKPSLDEAKGKVEEAKSRMSRLQKEQGQKWAPYHPRAEQLQKEIDRETRWRRKPVGPMGMHVHLLKPEWSSIVESTLGGTLNAYGVTSMEDQQMLNKIGRRVGCPTSSFIVGEFPLRTDDKEPQTGVDTILRILNIDDDVVRNVLIIQHFVDQTVLIQGIEEGRAFMYPRTGTKPRNVRATLTMAKDTKSRGQRWEYSRSGSEKVGPVRDWTGASRMKADRQQEIRIQSERVQDAQKKFGETEDRLRQLRNNENKAKQAVELYKREARKLKTAWQTAEDAVEAKQSEIDSNRPQDGKLQELERIKAETEDEKRSIEGAFEDVQEQKAALDESAHDLKDAVEKANEEVDKINGYIYKAQIKLDRCETSRLDALEKKNRVYDDAIFYTGRLQAATAEADGQQAIVTEWTAKASEVCERVRVNPGNTPEVLEKRLEKLQEQYRAAERAQGGTAAQLTIAWQEARTALAQAKSKQKAQLKLNNVLKKALQERYRRWGLFRKYISARTRIQFNYLLAERSFRGRVLLDHRDKTLDLSIEPDITKESHNGRKAQTLSGGEKSFSTICLLLSIWEAMGSPIRCLDEFDVFMDSVNRQQSMKLMIETARRSVGRQFILITPQAMGGVEMNDDVSVHKMSDPERGREAGQQPLNFGRA